MSTVSTPAAIPSFIEDLLEQRQSHVEAIGVIDATLARVSTALGVTDVTASIAKPVSVRPAGAAKTPATKTVAGKGAPKRRGKASKFGISANDFVLGFVESSKSATTQDINQHWKQSGRPGTADNSMSILTKLKKLKCSPMPGGQRGSRYSVA